MVESTFESRFYNTLPKTSLLNAITISWSNLRKDHSVVLQDSPQILVSGLRKEPLFWKLPQEGPGHMRQVYNFVLMFQQCSHIILHDHTAAFIKDLHTLNNGGSLLHRVILCFTKCFNIRFFY